MYKIVKNDKDISYGVKEFACDTELDILQLPRSEMGSTAFVLETGNVYMANSFGEWVKL